MVAKTETGFEFPDEKEYAGMVFESEGDLVVDLTNVKEMKFENVPKGTYNAKVDKTEFQMSKNTGAPMIAMTIAIDGGEFSNRKLTTYLSFSPKALPGTKANIMRIAPELATQAFKPAEVCANQTLIGRPLRIKVVMEDYNGEDRSRIGGILPAAQGASGADGFQS